MAFDGGPITEAEWAQHRRETMQTLPGHMVGKSLPEILLRSQRELLMATASSQVVVADKSRRIGFTWAAAADGVLTAGAERAAGGMDVLYIGTSMDMAREFIDACAMWARAFMPACTDVGDFLFLDQDENGADRHIQAFRIRFASGFEVVALSSRPRSLRGRQGYVILDEFAFHDQAAELLKAAMALLIRGGKVLVLSTHNGAENPFNELITDIRAGKRPGKVVRCTFDDAIEQGLYQSICLMAGREWSAEAEAKWRAEIYAYHGADADEELRCIPSQGSGVYLTRAIIEACSTSGGPEQVLRLTCNEDFEMKPAVERRSYVEAWLDQVVKPELAKLDPNLQHVFGQDFALTGDVSCYTPMVIERSLKRTVPFVIEMRRVPYDQQKQIVFAVTDQLPRFGGGKLDATGNGAILAQETKQKFGENLVEEVKLNQTWYIENMPSVKAGFEDRDIAIPSHVDLVDDMRQVRLIRGVPKVPENTRTKGSDGLQRHGDFAVSLALAHAASRAEIYQPLDYRPVRPGDRSRLNRDPRMPDTGRAPLWREERTLLVAQDTPQLVDHLERPLARTAASKAALSQAVATSSLTSVRQSWNVESVCAGLTPERLASIMRRAAEGDHYQYVILAEEMEERDQHYAGALAQRKLAVVGLQRLVEAASDDPQDQKIAEAVRELLADDEAFEDLITGCLDGLGKGWAAVEIAWDTAAPVWKPSSYEWRDPRWFRWDRETGQQLRMLDEADTVNGVELPPNRFAVHRPKLKMGLPVRGGLARLVAWAFLFKNYSVKDWAAYCETYGQPLRLGKYSPSATKEDMDVLYRAVAMIGTDCAAVIPQAMQIEFVDAMKGASMSGADLYNKWCDWLDRQVSKAVLGQTGTTDMQKGGGYAQAKVLDGVRDDLRDSDARQLARTIRRHVVEPFVRFNFGPAAKVPLLKLQPEQSEDLVNLANALTPFIDRGLKVSERQIREKFDLDEPGADDQVLQAAAGKGAPDAKPESDLAANRLGSFPWKQVWRGEHARAMASGHVTGCQCAPCLTVLAMNRGSVTAAGVADTDAIDALADPLDEGWEAVMTPLIEPIEHLAQRATSFEEFQRELVAASAAIDPTLLFQGLAAAAFKARGLGDATDETA